MEQDPLDYFVGTGHANYWHCDYVPFPGKNGEFYLTVIINLNKARDGTKFQIGRVKDDTKCKCIVKCAQCKNEEEKAKEPDMLCEECKACKSCKACGGTGKADINKIIESGDPELYTLRNDYIEVSMEIEYDVGDAGFFWDDVIHCVKPGEKPPQAAERLAQAEDTEREVVIFTFSTIPNKAVIDARNEIRSLSATIPRNRRIIKRCKQKFINQMETEPLVPQDMTIKEVLALIKVQEVSTVQREELAKLDTDLVNICKKYLTGQEVRRNIRDDNIKKKRILEEKLRKMNRLK